MIQTRIQKRWGTGAVLLAAALALGGCGTTTGDRTASGALLGAGAGTVVGAVTGLSLLQGALIGTAVGGVAGFVTDSNDFDLGTPPWRSAEVVKDPQPNAHVANTSGDAGANVAASTNAAAGANTQTASVDTSSSETVRSIQSGLERMGYDPGPVDGIDHPKTRVAIRSYQQYYNLAVDGLPSPQLAADIQKRAAAFQ